MSTGEKITKKTIKPSPIMLILSSVILLLAAAGFIVELTQLGEISSKGILISIVAVVLFGYSAVNFFTREKVEFDKNTFTVDGVQYEFSDISNADASAVQVLRGYSTLEIEIYVKGEYLFDFRKNESGAKEFIAAMKRHGVVINIED